MSKGKFKGIQVREINGGAAIELVIDFDNDRHHAGGVEKGFIKAGIVLLLRTIAKNIENDELIE